MKPLLLLADDYGYNREVDAGILALVEAGRLSGASCMSRAPGWSEAARPLRALRDRADVGLHLDFTEFAPAARPLWPFLTACLLGRVNVDALRREVAEQCARFEDATGTAPDYVDGHQHVHQFPRVREALLEELSVRYGAAPPWLRVSEARSGDGAKARFIAALGARALRAGAVQAGLRCSGCLLGVYGFEGDASAYERRLDGWLKRAVAGDALMCHPARAALPGDPIGAARAHEFAVLAGERFPPLLQQAGCVLVRGPVPT